MEGKSFDFEDKHKIIDFIKRDLYNPVNGKITLTLMTPKLKNKREKMSISYLLIFYFSLVLG